MISDSVGVVSARVSAGAESVIIEYDGTAAARRSVLQKLAAIGALYERLDDSVLDQLNGAKISLTRM